MANTNALWIVLTNNKDQKLTLISSKVIGSSSTSKVDLPATMDRATYGGLGTDASTTPYEVLWSYSPDGGKTLLNFSVKLSGAKGITITPSKSGPGAGSWVLSESPQIAPGAYLVRFYYN